ncbi:MAG: cation diffusion facilitator family transporter [Dehalococcoidia bacterium]
MIQDNQPIRVTLVGLVTNLFLLGLKLVVGLFVGSAALVADAVHSLSDLVTDVVAIVGIRLSARPADESHAYGHGRYETIAASLIGVALVGAGIAIAWNAGLSLYRQEHNIPGYPVLIVAAVSIVSKEWLYQITRRVARRVRSAALSANAWHHRSDALSSVAVLIGGAAGLLGWGHGDHVAAIAVGVMVAVVGLSSIWKVFMELTEGSISAEERQSIVKAIESVRGVSGWHRLRTRLVGREVCMDVHVLVDKNLSVGEGHAVCTAVEEAIDLSLDRPVSVVVHCEPEGETGEQGEQQADS